MGGAAASFALLEFRVRYTPARPGESICAVGEHPSLGCWDPAHSLKLRQPREEPGVWVSLAPVSVPSGVSIQYKYLLFHEGRFERWEAIDGNRIIAASGVGRVGGSLRPAADEFDVLAPSPAIGSRPSGAGPTLGGGGDGDGATGVSGQPAAYEAGVSEGGSILVVAYILPLLITREVETAGWVIEWNLDSVLARRASAGRAEGRRVVWIGCPGIPVAPADRQSLTEALAHFSAVPVYLEPKTHEEFYAGFCRSFLWPVFHNVIKAGAYSPSAWRAYCAVNRLFADTVVEVRLALMRAWCIRLRIDQSGFGWGGGRAASREGGGLSSCMPLRIDPMDLCCVCGGVAASGRGEGCAGGANGAQLDHSKRPGA